MDRLLAETERARVQSTAGLCFHEPFRGRPQLNDLFAFHGQVRHVARGGHNERFLDLVTQDDKLLAEVLRQDSQLLQ